MTMHLELGLTMLRTSRPKKRKKMTQAKLEKYEQQMRQYNKDMRKWGLPHQQLNLKEYIDLLRWAEGLIFIFPTWMYGPPAILKGWLERVWLPKVAFEISSGKQNIPMGKLKNISRLCVVTTSGSPRWWLWFIGNPGKSMLFKGYKILFNKYCKYKWLQLHDMNHTNSLDRERFLKKVSNYFSSI